MNLVDILFWSCVTFLTWNENSSVTHIIYMLILIEEPAIYSLSEFVFVDFYSRSCM